MSLASEISGGTFAGWLADDRAADLSLPVENVDAGALTVRIEAALPHADVFVQRQSERQRRLFVADMDSTMIAVECIDELADFANLKAEVAAVTEAAMRGELDFEAALRRRVSLLKGLDRSAIDRCREERVRFTPGAETLIATLRAERVRTVLVSGGFTAFAQPVADALGFDVVQANVLGLGADRLTGDLDGAVVDAVAKKALLLSEARQMGVPVSAAIAVGDGANDLQMVRAAGLGLAYRAKPALAEAADARIRNGDLTAILFALGIPQRRWTCPAD